MGGEEIPNAEGVHRVKGLPPRGRGRVSEYFNSLPSNRITPAWAGKRATKASNAQSIADYPRVGGEEPSGGVSATVQDGLPPRGRGRAYYHQCDERR